MKWKSTKRHLKREHSSSAHVPDATKASPIRGGLMGKVRNICQVGAMYSPAHYIQKGTLAYVDMVKRASWQLYFSFLPAAT